MCFWADHYLSQSAKLKKQLNCQIKRVYAKIESLFTTSKLSVQVIFTHIGSLRAVVGSFMDVNQQHSRPSFLLRDGSKIIDGLQ